MDRRKKVALVAVVLAAGIGSALQFQKTDSSASGTSPSATNSPGVTTTDAAGSTIGSTAPTRQEGTSFDGRIEPAPQTGATASSTGPSNVPAPHGEAIASVTHIIPPGPLVDVNAPEQTHTVVDGDTLTRLAERYLGRADRYLELYQHNRDVLRSPDVLPIGAELRIPSPLALTEVDPTAVAPTPEPTPITTNSAPVPTTLGGAQSTAARRGASRTYSVQKGDTLVDIARKFYGDGRRYESLFEANRQVLRSPTDLKVGTVLVVP